jgi:hypothetical protein
MSHPKQPTLVPTPKSLLTHLQQLAQRIRFWWHKPDHRPCRYCETVRPAESMLRGSIYGDFCNEHCRMQFWIAAEWGGRGVRSSQPTHKHALGAHKYP